MSVKTCPLACVPAKAAKKEEAERRKAAAAEAAAKKKKVDDLKQRMRRSKVYCNCHMPMHSEKCRIRGTQGQVLWPGAGPPSYVTRAEYEWFTANVGSTTRPRQDLQGGFGRRAPAHFRRAWIALGIAASAA